MWHICALFHSSLLNLTDYILLYLIGNHENKQRSNVLDNSYFGRICGCRVAMNEILFFFYTRN